MTWLAVLLAGSLAFAGGGNEVGNGGDAVVCESSVRLLDYYENEMLKRGALEFAKGSDPYAKAKALAARLERLNKKLASQYFEALSTVSKRIDFIDKTDFRDVKDSFEVGVPSGCKIAQLAIQQEEAGRKRIRISKKLWDRLDDDHRAGLILHEIIYEHFIVLGETNSVKARRFNSYLASKAILAATAADYQKFINGLKLPLY